MHILLGISGDKSFMISVCQVVYYRVEGRGCNQPIYILYRSVSLIWGILLLHFTSKPYSRFFLWYNLLFFLQTLYTSHKKQGTHTCFTPSKARFALGETVTAYFTLHIHMLFLFCVYAGYFHVDMHRFLCSTRCKVHFHPIESCTCHPC